MKSMPQKTTSSLFCLYFLLSISRGHHQVSALTTIRHVPCLNRMTGESGVCTFNWNCNVAHGVYIGHCVDRFFIGTCCKIPEKDGLYDTNESNGHFPDSGTSYPSTESTKQQDTKMDTPASIFHILATAGEKNKSKPIFLEKNGFSTAAFNSSTASNINSDSYKFNQAPNKNSWNYSSIPSINQTSSFHKIFSHSLQKLHNSAHNYTFNNHAPYAESFSNSPKLQEQTTTHVSMLRNETRTELFNKSQQSAYTHVYHDQPIRKPVIVDSYADARPASIHETFDTRKPVALNPQHDMRKPVSTHAEHDMRKPVETHAQHDMRKPVLFNEDHDQRWPVLEEDSHDSRTPTENYEYDMDWDYPTIESNGISNDNVEYFTDASKPVTELNVITLASDKDHSEDNIYYDASQSSNTIPSLLELVFSDLSNSESTNYIPISNDHRIYTLPPIPSTESLTISVTPAIKKDLLSTDLSGVCGRPKSSTTGRIVGGRKSHNLRWPWMISLQRYEEKTFKHKCGATLLNQFWAATAAHCVDGKLPEDLMLRLGEHNFLRTDNVYPHVERKVQAIVIHPKYDPATYENDLALLKFEDPIQYQANIVPVCLPTFTDDITGRIAVVTGWGKLAEEGELPDSLHEAYMPVISNKECEKMYSEAGYNEAIRDVFLCAGLPHGGLDACEGDSGGPMVIKTGGQWTLVGLISWGISCAAPKQPGVYTRISKFRDWITMIIA